MSLHTFICSMQTGDNQYAEAVCRLRISRRSVRSDTFAYESCEKLPTYRVQTRGDQYIQD